MARSVLVSSIVVGALSLSAVASAQDSAKPTANTSTPTAEVTTGWSAAALFGDGFGSSKIQNDAGNDLSDTTVNPYGLGFGGRAGYTLTSHIYVGGIFVYHTGESKDDKGIKYEASVLYPGLEAGYDLGVGPVLLRPYAGVGYLSIKVKASAGPNEIDRSSGKIGFWPGLSVLYPFDKYFVGIDARYVVASVDKVSSASAFTAFATGGLHF
jgi:hypothetical protein